MVAGGTAFVPPTNIGQSGSVELVGLRHAWVLQAADLLQHPQVQRRASGADRMICYVGAAQNEKQAQNAMKKYAKYTTPDPADPETDVLGMARSPWSRAASLSPDIRTAHSFGNPIRVPVYHSLYWMNLLSAHPTTRSTTMLPTGARADHRVRFHPQRHQAIRLRAAHGQPAAAARAARHQGARHHPGLGRQPEHGLALR